MVPSAGGGRAKHANGAQGLIACFRMKHGTRAGGLKSPSEYRVQRDAAATGGRIALYFVLASNIRATRNIVASSKAWH